MSWRPTSPTDWRDGSDFVTQSTFRAVGKAALQPVYARAHDAAATSDTRLSTGVRAALTLANIQPFIDDGVLSGMIYADAFYQPGELRHKAGHSARLFSARKAFIYVLEILALLAHLNGGWHSSMLATGPLPKGMARIRR